MSTQLLYFITFALSLIATALSLPILRRLIGAAFLDTPTPLKHHIGAIPAIGGCAIFIGLSISLIFIRLTTQFPSGTLHSLRGILCGSAMIFALGMLDDLRKPKGLGILLKLCIQFLAVCCLLRYGVHIRLFQSTALCYLFTFLWVVGITNAFNLLDILDGLCVSQAVICTVGLIVISLPSEQIYVNFAACALLGACVGFWPYNHWTKCKSFLGDSGSTLLGFLIAALTMGADYSEVSQVGFLAPLFIVAVAIFDTGFVSIIRLLHKQNPLRGSNDHIALRLQKKGFSANKILIIFILAAVCCNVCAFAVIFVPACVSVSMYVLLLFLAAYAAYFLAHIPMEQHD